MTSDGGHHGAYNPALINVVLSEAAHLLRHLGFTASHTVLIGGVAPSLLVLDPATNLAHVGTTDLDLCLSVAIVEGDTAEYERIENALKKAGYEPTDESFRWRQSSRMRLEVEFFCPAGDGRPSGRMFRPKAADNPIAKQNFGPRLAAIALDAGHVIGDDVVVVQREVELPDDGGRTMFDFRVTGVLGFIVAKVGALVGRDNRRTLMTSCGSSRTGTAVPQVWQRRSRPARRFTDRRLPLHSIVCSTSFQRPIGWDRCRSYGSWSMAR